VKTVFDVLMPDRFLPVGNGYGDGKGYGNEDGNGNGNGNETVGIKR